MSRTRFAGIHLNNVAAAPEIVSLLAQVKTLIRPIGSMTYIRRKTVFSSINQTFGLVEFFAEVRVFYGCFVYEIDFASQKKLQFFDEVEESNE